MGLTYPEISPIMLQIGPIAIRWYSMAYLFGIVFGWLLIRHYVTPLPNFQPASWGLIHTET